MDIEAASCRFHLSDELTESLKIYFKKAENAQVLYCENHDRKFFDFEVCPWCESEDKI